MNEVPLYQDDASRPSRQLTKPGRVCTRNPCDWSCWFVGTHTDPDSISTAKSPSPQYGAPTSRALSQLKVDGSVNFGRFCHFRTGQTFRSEVERAHEVQLRNLFQLRNQLGARTGKSFRSEVDRPVNFRRVCQLWARKTAGRRTL